MKELEILSYGDMGLPTIYPESISADAPPFIVNYKCPICSRPAGGVVRQVKTTIALKGFCQGHCYLVILYPNREPISKEGNCTSIW
jgi:hypothetical protein